MQHYHLSIIKFRVPHAILYTNSNQSLFFTRILSYTRVILTIAVKYFPWYMSINDYSVVKFKVKSLIEIRKTRISNLTYDKSMVCHDHLYNESGIRIESPLSLKSMYNGHCTGSSPNSLFLIEFNGKYVL